MKLSPKKQQNLYYFLVFLLVICGFVWLVVKLVGIQIGNTELYRGKVASKLNYEGTLKAERGRIFDSDGEEIAVNVTKYRIFLSPGDVAELKRLAEEAKAEGRTYDENHLHAAEFIAENLSGIIDVSAEELLALCEETNRFDVTLVKEADRELADAVNDFREKYDLTYAVNVEAFSKRTYLFDSLAAQTIGFVGGEGNGVYGLEAYYNDILTGTDGRYTALTDARNRVINGEYSSYVEPKNGNELHLTLNRKVQEVLAEQVKAAALKAESVYGAYGLVMNAKTGAVLGMATYPDFDCNNPHELTGYYTDRLVASSAELGYEKDSREYNTLLGQIQMEMWRNRAVSFPYDPGSTFKPITACIGLETQSFGMSSRYTCGGGILSVDHVHTIKCSQRYGHGDLNLEKALQQSCNPWFIHYGLEIGTATFWDSMDNIGYFRLTGIDLPAENETIFWKRSEFTPADLETCAFGQNFKVTAVRHLTCLSAIANDGFCVQPHLVESITDSKGNTVWQYAEDPAAQVFSKKVTDDIAKILADGVAGNGGSSNAYVAGYRVAAKTGTSEKIGEVDEYNKICSCMAFAPYDDPEIIMIIAVDSPKDYKNCFGNTVAAPYVSKALAQILPYLGVETRYTQEEAAKRNVRTDDYVGKTVSAAKTLIENKELNCVVFGTGTVVTAQMPEAGTNLSKDGGKVVLFVGGEAPERTVIMPDFKGMGASEARNTALRLGLNLEETGTTNYGSRSTVVGQSVSPGTRLIPGEVITLDFLCQTNEDD